MDTKLTASAASRRKTRLFMIGAFLVAAVAFVVISAGGINKNLVYYWTPTDLHAAGDKAYGATIRLGGMVAQNSVKGRTGASGLEFDVKDATGIVHVKSTGVPPQMFRENIGVARAIRIKSTPGDSFTLRAWTLRISNRPLTSGSGTYTRRSNRPRCSATPSGWNGSSISISRSITTSRCSSLSIRSTTCSAWWMS